MIKLLILLITMLLLTGCSNQPVETAPNTQPTSAPATAPSTPPTTDPPSTEAPEAPDLLGPGLHVLCSFTAEDGLRPMNVTARGSEAAVLLRQYPEDPERPARYVRLLDTETGAAGEPFPLEDPEADFWNLSLEADGSLLCYSPYEDIAARYDRQGHYLGPVENLYPAPEDFRFPHVMVNDWFSFQGDFASYRSYENGSYLFSAYAFSDDPEALYLLNGAWGSTCAASGRRLLESNYLRDNAGLSYRVVDLEAGLELDRVTLENLPGEAREHTFLNEVTTLFCDSGVLLRVDRDAYAPDAEYGEGGDEPEWEALIYLWRLEETAAVPLTVTRVTEPELEAENAAIAARIGKTYEIDIHLDQAPEGDTPPLMAGDDWEALRDAELVTGIEAFPTYELLTDLEHFLAKLPAGFTHEMQADFPEPRDEYGTTDYEGLDIYVIKEIPGGSAAYANGWGARMRIVLATDEFSASILPHEFMHLIERRLWACYEAREESFFDQWMALNPADFDYYSDKDQTDLLYNSFVSSYAMTNDMEDRAETFMMVFMSLDPLEECFWYQNGPGVQAKVAFLLSVIRQCYPSVQATDRAWWEKPESASANYRETTDPQQ